MYQYQPTLPIAHYFSLQTGDSLQVLGGGVRYKYIE